jgi:phytoene synthase
MAARSPEPSAQRRADRAACRVLLRSGSHSFYLASLLLPRRVGDAATALYAFCRLADDAVDMPGCAATRVQADLHAQLERIYAGRPAAQPMERLLAGVIETHAIPRSLLSALLEGFEWDVQGRRYATAAALNSYAARVAGSVGALMCLLMGVRAPAVVARACDLGVAMQLTNIARDVGQDARAGRLYLPLDWLREADIDAERWLAQPQFSPALGAVIERLLQAADALYERSAAGIAGLPADCRPGIHAARLLYAEIGNDLRRHGLDAVTRRAHVGAARKARLLGAALCAAARATVPSAYAALPETRFLVDAVEPLAAAGGNAAQRPADMGGERGGSDGGGSDDGARNDGARSDGARELQQGQAEWLMELFERLQRRDQRLAARPAGARG